MADELTGTEGLGDAGTPRSASVRLRDSDTPATARLGSRMDPANQSLADALRITFVLLKVAMVVLGLLYILSGFQPIQEGERGISVRFGRKVQTNLDPGFQFAAPYPFGELVKVGEGTVEARLDRSFMPWIEPGQEDMPDSRLPLGRELNPERDGSNITADRNLAHTQWTVNYRRVDHAAWAENVNPGPNYEFERRLVQAVVGRAVVHAVAETNIDDLLKDSGQTAARAREIAQRMFDTQIDAGIRIDQLILNRKIPPPNLLENFNRVNQATQQAGKARQEAYLERNKILNGVAGAASELLIEQIDEYERAIELGHTAEAEQILVKIDSLMDGSPVEIDGVIYQDLAGGEVSEILAGASNRAFALKNRARAQYQMFLAKDAQYKASPSLMISREWSSAFTAFMQKEFVQAMALDGNATGELIINSDPDLEREIERARNRLEAQRAQDARQQAAQDDRRRSQRGVVQEDGP